MSLKQNLPVKPVPIGLVKANVLMLVLNLVGVTSYLCFVAVFIWLSPKERAMGVDYYAGDSVVWFMFVVPVFAIYLILNCIWAGFIIAYRYSKGRLYWRLTALVWIVAVIIDYAHH